jgi:tetratricopeptide (TPR) repeat protein
MNENSKQLLLSAVSQGAVVFLSASLIARPLTSGETIGQDLDLLLQFFPLFAALLWLARMVLNREVRYEWTSLEAPLAIYAAAIVLSLFRASCLFPALMTAFDWLVDILLFCLIAQAARETGARRNLERVFLATAMVVAVYGLIQRFKGFPEMWEWIERNPDEARRMLGIWDDVNWNDLKSRLGTNEVFSTFLIPNALAGYFLMVIPVLAADLLLSGLGSRVQKLAFGMKCLAMAAVVGCMLLTGAKGAWLCLPVQGVLFLLLLGEHVPGRVRRYGIAGTIAAVALAAALLLLVPPLRERAWALWDSLHVRFGYWETSCVMLRDGLNAVFGVGLANFQEVYPFFKTVTASEVQKAHNHYLQLWTEIGIFGMAAFVAVWALCLFRSLRRPLAEERQDESGKPWTQVSIFFGGLLGFLTVCNFAQPFKSVPSSTDAFLIAAAVFVLWTLYVAADGSNRGAGDSRRETVVRRAGYLAAIAGILLHSLIDFDLSIPGCAQSLWLVGALALSLAASRGTWACALGEVRQGVSMLAVLAVFAGLTLGVLPRVTESEAMKARARDVLSQAVSQRDPQKRAGQLDTAIGDFLAAAARNPIDPDTLFEMGTAYQHVWMTTGDPEAAGMAYDAMKRGIELAPYRAGFHFRLGQFLEILAVKPPAVLESHILPDYESGDVRLPVPRSLLPALAEYQRAADLYPTKPEAWLAVADMLWRIGLKEESLARYKDVLALDDQIHPRWHNLKLPADVRKRVEERLAGP